ncbi:MAG: serpin family protein [Phycisphaerales bacterium]|nr:serpin family protein [Phycisphaerales bacterium]
MRGTLLCALVVVILGIGARGYAEVAVDTTGFAVDLYGRLAEEQGAGNLFFSPVSVSTALAMTYVGARGETAEQMGKVLRVQGDAEKVGSFFGGMMGKLNRSPEVEAPGPREVVKRSAYQLFLANALWGQQSEPFRPEFVGFVEKHFGAGLNSVDFAGRTEEARVTINDWVAKRTEDRIKDLIGPNVLGRDTRLVLTNAIYFKSDWQSRFTKALTKEGEFRFTPNRSWKNVPLMQQTGFFAYGEDEDLQVLEMPYLGHALSMVVVLPREVGFEGVKLTVENLKRWQKELQPTNVAVTFPRFTFSSSFSLKKTLPAMGMVDAFDGEKADFSGMTTGGRLAISDVIHKAFVAVDEEGTEAAAATAVMMSRTAAPMREPKVFRADRPFIFLIRHNATKEILFMGRVSRPSGS